MDSSRMFSAMDEIFAEGDLRVVRAPVLVYADLLSGYAAAIAAPRRGWRAGYLRSVGGERLAALYAGGTGVAGHRATHSLQDLSLLVFRFARPSHLSTI